jgi:predicted nucleic acid-binding protein
MNAPPRRIFLDTNVYIVGSALEGSPEALILDWAGWGDQPSSVEVVVSDALLKQIARVARRIRDKDWAGELLSQIWRSMHVVFVLLDPLEILAIEEERVIPREDATVYLSARRGRAECFVSANHELVRILTTQTGDFVCLTPEEFVRRYLQ